MKKLTAILLILFGFPSFTLAAEKETELYIKEMTCQLCVYLVNKELRAIEGVVSTKASMKDRTVKIIADEKVTLDQFTQAVEKLHYTAELVDKSGQ